MQYPRSILHVAAASAVALLLAACGSDGPLATGPNSTVSGVAAVGAPVSGGTVSARCRSGVAPSTVSTAANGSYSITIPNVNYPCALRVSGGMAGGVANTLSLHSLASGGGTRHITPLTDLALALSVNSAAGQALAAWFAAPSNWFTVDSGLVAALDALRTALVNAGYGVPSSWTAGSATPFSGSFTPDPATDPYDALLEALAQGIEDSATYSDYAAFLSGLVAGGSVPAAPVDEEAPANLAVLTAYAGAYTVSGTATGDEALRGTATRQHVRGSITIGANGNIDFDTGISFTVGSIVEIFDRRTVSTDRRVAVNYADTDAGERIRIYLNEDLDVVEIIHDDGQGGSTRAAIGAMEPGLPAPTGDGAALGGADGATGTLNGTTYTYTRNAGSSPTNVGWGAGNPGGTVGNFTAYASSGNGFDPLTSWRISGVPSSVGTHACGTPGNLPVVRLTRGGVVSDSTACTIEILAVTGSTVTGRFSAAFTTGTITDGYFRVSPTTGGGGALPAGEQGASFTLAGTDYRYTRASDLSFETFVGVSAQPAASDNTHPGYPVGVQLHTIPNRLGTYACDTHEGNAYRKVNVWFWWNGKWYYAGTRQNPAAGPAGSSCSITLTQVGSTIEGSFNGTFVASDSSTVVVTDGLFRYIASP